ncbi:hypothetical protein Tco_0413451 [Tanacetum coccineum]
MWCFVWSRSYGELDGVVSPANELVTPKLVKLVKIGPISELDGAPTLSDGHDTTKTVETNLVILRRLWFHAIIDLTSVLTLSLPIDDTCDVTHELLKLELHSLVAALNREVCSDVRKLGEYRRMSRDLWKSVRRLGVSITELRVLGDFGDGNEALRYLGTAATLEAHGERGGLSFAYVSVIDGYSQTSKAYIVLNKETLKIEESLNVTFDESLPKSRTSPLVDDDMIEEQAIQNHDKTKNPNCDLEEVIPRVENIREVRDHPIDQNLRTLRKPSRMKVGQWLYKRNLTNSYVTMFGILFLVRSTCQSFCDEFSRLMHDEFEMSMMGDAVVGNRLGRLDHGLTEF